MKVHESWIIHKKRNYIILMINRPTPGWKFAIYSISYLKFGYATNGDHNEVAFHHKLISSITRAWNRHIESQYAIHNMTQVHIVFLFFRHISWTPQKEGRYKFHRDLPRTSANWLSNSYEKHKVPCKKHSVFVTIVTIQHPLVLCERTTVWIQWILSRD